MLRCLHLPSGLKGSCLRAVRSAGDPSCPHREWLRHTPEEPPVEPMCRINHVMVANSLFFAMLKYLCRYSESNHKSSFQSLSLPGAVACCLSCFLEAWGWCGDASRSAGILGGSGKRRSVTSHARDKSRTHGISRRNGDSVMAWLFLSS